MGAPKRFTPAGSARLLLDGCKELRGGFHAQPVAQRGKKVAAIVGDHTPCTGTTDDFRDVRVVDALLRGQVEERLRGRALLASTR